MQVAVKGALIQLVQKVVEKLLVTALYSSKCFVLMKEVDHLEQRNYPRYLAHLSCVNFRKTILKFILPKITFNLYVLINFVMLVNYIIQYYKRSFFLSKWFTSFIKTKQNT